MRQAYRFQQVPVDKVADFWDARPCNVRHSTAPVGTRQYFDEVEARRYFVEPHIPIFAEFPRWSGKKVLEVGCEEPANPRGVQRDPKDPKNVVTTMATAA